jgi:3-deoxy-D-manno-octulosonic-acid transferase
MAAVFEAIRADVIVIDRYDVWPTFMQEARHRGIPVVLMNATFPSAARSRALGGIVRSAYERIHTITAVSMADAGALSAWLGRTIPALPDTRMDRVLERIATPDPKVLGLRRPTVPTIVLGSCWPPDEEIMFDAVGIVGDPSIRLIIVPHEPTEDAMGRIERRLPVTRLSQVTDETTGHILVDAVGHLLSLYAIADAAHVGGGFGVGVHSLAEPAGYGVPLSCGPAIDRSRDGADLVELGACTVIRSAADAARWITSVVLEPRARQEAGSRALDYVRTRSGAAKQYAIHIASLINEQR